MSHKMNFKTNLGKPWNFRNPKGHIWPLAASLTPTAIFWLPRLVFETSEVSSEVYLGTREISGVRKWVQLQVEWCSEQRSSKLRTSEVILDASKARLGTTQIQAQNNPKSHFGLPKASLGNHLQNFRRWTISGSEVPRNVQKIHPLNMWFLVGEIEHDGVHFVCLL